jgi:hypothetical protein
MPRLQRLIAASVLFALSAALAGCGTNGSFDPSDLLDFLDQKKKLPGDRKPVFPDGVPGIEQGVPKELYKGANAQQQDQPPVIEPTPAPAPAPKKKPAAKTASRAKPAPKPAEAPPAADPDASGPDGEEGMAAAPPAPPPPKTKRTRATALPKDQPSQQSDPSDQQQAASPFPAPLPR